MGTLIIAFGGLISCFMLVKLIVLDSSIIAISMKSTLVPLSFGTYLTRTDILIISAAFISFIYIILSISKKRFGSNINFLCIIYITVIAPYLVSNLIISLSVFSIASVFIMYFSVINNDRKLSTAHLTTDFIWQRVSDIAAFISLFLILMNNKTIILYKLVDQRATSPSLYAPLFFGAMILRIITIPASNNYIKFSTDNGFNYFVLGRIFSSLGALLFLFRLNKIIFDSLKPDSLYLIITGLLLCHAVFSIIKFNKFTYLPTNFSYAGFILALGAMILGINYCALIIILVVIIFTPILIIITSQMKLFKKNQEALRISEDPIVFVGRYAQRFAQLGATISARFASLVYANFLFYRLPQLIIGLFQVPLRIFHTGSIHRSVLFIVLLIATYFWLWG